MRSRNKETIQRQNELRYQWLVKNKVNHLNPTISPANKLGGVIESPIAAFNYYKDNGFDSVIVQTKHMGSYADVYLLPKLEDCYIISRNSYKINRIPNVHEVIRPVWEKYQEGSLTIVACELMPWSALGKGLIQREYESYQTAINNMKAPKFDIDLSIYLRDRCLLNKEQLSQKYKAHELRFYKAAALLRNPKEVSDGVERFKESLWIHGLLNDDETPWLVPFRVVKVEDSEVKVCPDPKWKLQTNTLTCTTAQQVEQLFNSAKIKGQEGIVVKPAFYKEGVARCLKVRTNDYLHLIYGMDFGYNHHIYYRNRRTNRKLGMHLKQARISQQLAAIPYNDITLENQEYRKLVSQFFNLELKAEHIDNTL